MKPGIPLPRIVSKDEWQAAHEKLLAKEKAATRAGDALAAERRLQPMYRIEKDYVFVGPRAPASLGDLFEGRRQLALYHFMFAGRMQVVRAARWWSTRSVIRLTCMRVTSPWHSSREFH